MRKILLLDSIGCKISALHGIFHFKPACTNKVIRELRHQEGLDKDIIDFREKARTSILDMIEKNQKKEPKEVKKKNIKGGC
jgi:hypothetical protein